MEEENRKDEKKEEEDGNNRGKDKSIRKEFKERAQRRKESCES